MRPGWLGVKQVVDYAHGQGMYVILNIHWDGGWLEEHPLFSYQQAVNQKQSAYWTQIATTFRRLQRTAVVCWNQRSACRLRHADHRAHHRPAVL